MVPPFRYRLSDREKDALLSEQAALIERLATPVRELEGLLAKPKKASQNSHTPSLLLIDTEVGVPSKSLQSIELKEEKSFGVGS